MIAKEGGKYVLRSRSSGRVLGRSTSKPGITHREKQVQFFKNLEKSRGGPGSLRAKVRKRSLLTMRNLSS